MVNDETRQERWEREVNYNDDWPIPNAAQIELDGKQPLNDALTSLSNLELTDGQTPVWNDSLEEFVASNPVGQSLNVEAVNTTSVATTATGSAGFGTIVAIPGTSISVSNSNGRPVRLELEASFQQVVAGTGKVWFIIEETTSGNVNRRYVLRSLPNSTTVGIREESIGVHSLPIGVVTAARTFQIKVAVLGVTGSPSIQVYNQPAYPTILRAINL